MSYNSRKSEVQSESFAASIIAEWPADIQVEYHEEIKILIKEGHLELDAAENLAVARLQAKYPHLDNQREKRRFTQYLDKAKKELLAVPQSEFLKALGQHCVKLFRKTQGWYLDPKQVEDAFATIAYDHFQITQDDFYAVLGSSYGKAKKNPAQLLSRGNPVTVYDEYGKGLVGDLALAEYFIKAHGDNLRYVASQAKWFIYNDGIWEQDDVLEHEYLAWQTCLQLANSEPDPMKKPALVRWRIAQTMLQASRSDIRIKAEMGQWDNDSWLLSSASSVINLRTGASREARPDDYITKQASVTPDFETQPKRWLQFLQVVTGNNPALIDYLQLLCGYCLTGSTREHQFFFFYGTGRNGKSVFMNVLYTLLQDYTRYIPDTMLMA